MERGADPSNEAARWTRVIGGLHTSHLRTAWMRDAMRVLPARTAAGILDAICARAESGAMAFAVAMHAVVELLAAPDLEDARRELRAETKDGSFSALGRLLRRPFLATKSNARLHALHTVEPSDDEPQRDVPDYGRGRPLTLGERKSLARLPPPELLPKVLADPHPDVIRNLLASSRLTEDHVVRLCTKRPNHAEVLREVARHPRWCQRPRVRMSLVLNPDTPNELAIAMVALLHRSELAIVMETTAIHPVVRAAACDRFVRLPPLRQSSLGRVQ